ncbi:MAG: transglycosylase SLT domain-containing protein [Cognatishimia sp.]
MIKTYLFMSLIMAVLLLPYSARAKPQDPSEICEQSARHAAQKTGVPQQVMRAIMLVETGQRKDGNFTAWPWTVNMEGKGVWFDSRPQALDYTQNHHDKGSRSFDIGCFQINYRWHGAGFDSISHMFDPNANALYAAKFLQQLYQETHDWSRAAGAYHSRTPKYAQKYRLRFDQVLARISPQNQASDARPDTDLAQATRQQRPNKFPLLQAQTAPSHLGSLVPAELAAAQPLFGG